jgi:hypothetical protein
MSERVESYAEVLHDGLRWEPNAPAACLVSDDFLRSAMALRAHPDDSDQRCVVLVWDVVSYALMGQPNDEALYLHRLYDVGLKNILWIGVVRDSNLVEAVRPMLGRDFVFRPLHYVVPLKECVVEVLAQNVDVVRAEGTPREAAVASIST